MDTKGKTQEYRLSKWVEVMCDREESGLGIREYCKKAGFHENKYYYWQKKLREAACNELMTQDGSIGLAPQGFTEITVQAQPIISLSTASLENHICIEAGGVRISASCEYPVEKLTKVLRMAVQPC